MYNIVRKKQKMQDNILFGRFCRAPQSPVTFFPSQRTKPLNTLVTQEKSREFFDWGGNCVPITKIVWWTVHFLMLFTCTIKKLYHFLFRKFTRWRCVCTFGRLHYCKMSSFPGPHDTLTPPLSYKMQFWRYGVSWVERSVVATLISKFSFAR